MSIVKVIEVISEGTSVEAAIEGGLKEASKTLDHIKQIDVTHIHAKVDNNKVVKYRLDLKVSFVVTH